MTKGQKRHVRSPSGIVNAEHNDPSGSKKVILGTPTSIEQIIADATTEKVVQEFAILRIHNADAAIQYIWVGEEDVVPGAITAANGIPIQPGAVENFYVGESSDNARKSMMIKASSANLEIVELKV